MQNDGWLNDQIINTTLERFNRQLRGERNIRLLDSFFYSSLVTKSPPQFPRREDTTRFTANQVLWPCNKNNHWFLVVVDNRNHCIRVIDSLYTANQTISHTCATQIQQWQEQFLRHRSLNQLADQVAQYPVTRQSLPKQRNFNDCGVALLWAAEKLFQGENKLGHVEADSPYANYRQQLVPYFRVEDDGAIAIY